jgi:Mn2+/Fe2+ NRAMP family transporter
MMPPWHRIPTRTSRHPAAAPGCPASVLFWQASQEVEELRADDQAAPLRHAPAQVAAQFSRIRFDTLIGMGVSNVVAFFIMLTAAATLHVHGVHDVQSSAQAASALRPIAGELAFMLFAMGIVGTGMPGWMCTGPMLVAVLAMFATMLPG